MTDHLAVPRVTVLEVAAMLGVSPGSLQFDKARPDWAGRPSLSAPEAAAFVEQHRTNAQRWKAAQEAHDAFLSDRAARRSEVVSEARASVLEPTRRESRLRLAQMMGGSGKLTTTSVREGVDRTLLAQQAGDEAGDRFDRKNPPLELLDWLDGPGRNYR